MLKKQFRLRIYHATVTICWIFICENRLLCKWSLRSLSKSFIYHIKVFKKILITYVIIYVHPPPPIHSVIVYISCHFIRTLSLLHFGFSQIRLIGSGSGLVYCVRLEWEISFSIFTYKYSKFLLYCLFIGRIRIGASHARIRIGASHARFRHTVYTLNSSNISSIIIIIIIIMYFFQ